MTKPVIEVEGLSKLYRLGATVGHDTLRDRIADGMRSLLGMGGVRASKEPDDLWALKDVSFDVHEGDVIGIIGRNGAGKSTLLKILSRITDPTSGTARIRGRVASLLEVGTGFHPELTGRENIYLNGAILGMRRDEIKARFDEIVAFAEVERFLDTPVKRYSSGMYVRLAFAVAAHIDPEVLIVDEVLAVGDAQFQKKCLGKMQDVSQGGRTVLFVSHNMAAVQNLCKRAILLDKGRITANDVTENVIASYANGLMPSEAVRLGDVVERKGDGRLRMTDVSINDKHGRPLDAVFSGQDITVEISYLSAAALSAGNISVAIGFYDLKGDCLFICGSETVGKHIEVTAKTGRFACNIPRFPLTPGRYYINFFCKVGEVIADWVQQGYSISVIEGDFFGTGKLPPSHGAILVEHAWEQFTSDKAG